MKPEHTKEFNADHAKAGAPYCRKDGGEATVSKFDARDIVYKLVGHSWKSDAPDSWDVFGNICIYQPDDGDLVMTPLAIIDGKPVFVGDELLCRQYGNKFTVKPGAFDLDCCEWPAPEKSYPVTLMTPGELTMSYVAERDHSFAAAITRVANAALRHAIDAGQVATKEYHEQALQQLGSLCNIAEIGSVLRDAQIAEAVRNACRYALVGDCEYEKEMTPHDRMSKLDLAAIIATVK